MLICVLIKKYFNDWKKGVGDSFIFIAILDPTQNTYGSTIQSRGGEQEECSPEISLPFLRVIPIIPAPGQHGDAADGEENSP